MERKYIVEYSQISAANSKYEWIAYEAGSDGEDFHAYGETPAKALQALMLYVGECSDV
jgi:hypothetical protein